MISNGKAMSTEAVSPPDPPNVFEARGEWVMLAADVAAAFGVETRQVVQNIKNNPAKRVASAEEGLSVGLR
jgi:hypothetical protein